MTSVEQEQARLTVLSALSERTDKLQPPLGLITAFVKEASERLKLVEYMVAIEAELWMRRELARGELIDFDGYVIFEALTATEAEDLATRREDDVVSTIVDAISRLRYDAREGLSSWYSTNNWYVAQKRYACMNHLDDPCAEKSPTDSESWLRLMIAARDVSVSLAMMLRRMRSEEVAELISKNGHASLRAMPGKEGEYASIRNAIVREKLSTGLTKVLTDMRM